jgi:hypothetical protein
VAEDPEPEKHPRRWLDGRTVVGIALVVAGGVGVFRSCRSLGDPVGKIQVPGTLALPVRAGDIFRFALDGELQAPGTAKAEGCKLDVTITQRGAVVDASACELFGAGDKTGAAPVRVEGERLTCRLRVKGAGRATLEARANLAACAPKGGSATVHVFRERSSP